MCSELNLFAKRSVESCFINLFQLQLHISQTKSCLHRLQTILVVNN